MSSAEWTKTLAAALVVGGLCLLGLSLTARPQEDPSDHPTERLPSPQAAKRAKKLPGALIIGVKKGGTRALLEFLRLHPAVDAPGPEVHFFDRYYHRGLDWYRAQMPAVSEGTLVVEKTPAYFVKRDVPAKVAQMSPSTKLVLVLRDPVTRALSDYAQSHAKGRTLKPFAEMAFRDGPASRVVEGKWNAVRLGLYERHLRKWLPHFPLQQIHVVSGERLVSHPVDEVRAVEAFLGLPPHIRPDHFSFNSTKGFPCLRRRPEDREFKCLGATKGRVHPRVGAAALDTLHDFFRPHNERLYQLIGRDLGWDQTRRRPLR